MSARVTGATASPRRAALAVSRWAAGPAVVFQHGLGGDAASDGGGVSATAAGGADARMPRARRLEAGRVRPLRFRTSPTTCWPRDRGRGVGRFAVGGISMGAAIALRLAVRHPRRVGAAAGAPGLAVDPAPPNLAPVAEGRLSRRHPRRGAGGLCRSRPPRAWPAAAPDNLASLRGFFDAAGAGGTAELSPDRRDGPGSGGRAAAIAVPTLVIGTARTRSIRWRWRGSLAAPSRAQARRGHGAKAERPEPGTPGRCARRSAGSSRGRQHKGPGEVRPRGRRRRSSRVATSTGMLAEFSLVVGRSRQPRDGARAGGALRRPAPRRRCRRPLRPGLPVLSRPRRADRRADAPPHPRAPDGRGGAIRPVRRGLP